MSAEIDDLLSAAINALSTAQVMLRKSAPARSVEVLRKAHPGKSTEAALDSTGDALTKATAALATLDSLNRRLDKLEAGRTIGESQWGRKTSPREAS